MKIIKHRKPWKLKLHGTCKSCQCRVEVNKEECKELIDRDTQPGMATLYVKCPECGEDYLWVK